MDTIVVGAGLAGLAAARELAEAGQTLRVLEARERAGGRVWTRHDAALPLPVELGAEFLGGPGSPCWTLLQEAGGAVYPAAGAQWRFRDGGLQRLGGLREQIDPLLRRLEPGRTDRPLTEALDACCTDADGDARALLVHYVQGYHAAPADRISTRWLCRAEAEAPGGGGGEFHALSGCDAAVRALAAPLKARGVLRLGCRVTAVRWSADGVQVQYLQDGDRRALHARRALVTLPLGVLRAGAGGPGAVRFEPELPDHRAAARRLGVGHVVRLTLRFATRFWEELELAGEPGALRDAKFLHLAPGLATWWTPLRVHAPLLTAWSGGPAAEALLESAPEQWLERALGSLATLLGLSRRELEGRLEGWYTHNWSADPLALGAYSYVPAGATDAPGSLARPVGDVLFFAGEATVSDGGNATMDGAVRSGRRAAAEILHAARPDPVHAGGAP